MKTRLHCIAVTLLLTVLGAASSAAQQNEEQLRQQLAKGAAELGAQVAKFVELEKIVGAELYIAHRGKVVFHQGYGWMDREDERKMVPDTIFNIRSMTKPMTGAAAQLLIDEGKMKADDPVAKFIPSFGEHGKDNILVKHLMQHRSGLPLTMFQAAVDEFDSLAAIADAAAKAELRFEPGTQFYYSDAGSDVLGAVVAAVAGMPVDQFIQQRLLTPLQMKDCFYTLEPDDPRGPRMASLYVGFSGTWLRQWQPDGGSMYPFAWGSQTLYSTPRDYGRFLQMWMDGGQVDGKTLLSKEAVKRMLTPASKMLALGSDKEMPTGFPGLTTSYGQMSVLYQDQNDVVRIIGHSGSDGTLAYAWPQRDLILCMFTQSRGGSIFQRFEADIHRLLLDPASNQPPPAEFAPLIGMYRPETGPMKGRDIEVLMLNEKLAIDVPGQMVFSLTPADEEGWRSFEFDPRAKVKFEVEGLADNALAPAFIFQAPGAPATERVPRLLNDGAQKPVGLDAKYHKFFGYYWDPDSRVEVKFAEHDGKLAAHHPAVPTPLTFTEIDDNGFWTMELNPAVKIKFVEDESGQVVRYDVHMLDQVVPRKRLRGLHEKKADE